jgi:radical SAM superfamily enzyme YgiQ (UPF0313 family)
MSQFDLIHIHPSATRRRPSFFLLPVGVFGMLNQLASEGRAVLAINEPLEMALDPDFDVGQWLRKFSAPCYTIDLHWHEHLEGAMAVARAIRSAQPRSLIAIGGITATLYADQVMHLCPEIDVVVAGYGEQQLPRVLDLARRGPNPSRRQILRNLSVPDLESQDFVTRDFLLHNHEYTQCSIHQWHHDRIQTQFWLKNGQGCRGTCSFCGGARTAQRHIFGNARILRRSCQRVAEDLIALSRQNVRQVALTHDISQASMHYWRRLHEIIRAAGVSVGIYMEANSIPSREYIGDFARTFALDRSVLTLTPLCESENVRRRNGKHFTNRDLLECLDAMKSHRVQHALYFSSGLPFSSQEEELRTAAFAKQLERNPGCLFAFRTTLALDPASPMQRHPHRHGIRTTLNCCADYLNRCCLRSASQPYDTYGYCRR